MAGHGIFGALAQGAAAFGTPDSRAAARLRKAQSDAELANLNLRQDSGVEELGLDVLKEQLALQSQQLKAQSGQLARNTTDEAFRSFNIDGNPKHFNNALKDPTIAKLFPDVTSVLKVDPVNDLTLLEDAGLTPESLQAKRYLKFLSTDGESSIVDMSIIQATTGFDQRMNDEERTRFVQEMELSIAKQKADSGSVQAQANLIQAKRGPKEPPPTTTLRDSKESGRIADKEARGETLTGQEKAFKARIRDKNIGNVAGQQAEVRDIRDRIIEQAGSRQKFAKLDFSSPIIRDEFEADIQDIERIGKLELDRDTIKILRETGKLANFAGGAGELTSERTGAFDNLWATGTKYLEGQVDQEQLAQMQAASEYRVMRNFALKAMSGAAVTANEAVRDSQAFGTLNQRFPAVMSQFKTLLNGMKSDMESVVTLNDSMVARFRSGGSLDDINDAIKGIDATLNAISNANTLPTVGPGERPAKEPGFLARMFGSGRELSKQQRELANKKVEELPELTREELSNARKLYASDAEFKAKVDSAKTVQEKRALIEEANGR